MLNDSLLTGALLACTATHAALNIVIFYLLVHIWPFSFALAWHPPLPPKMHQSRLVLGIEAFGFCMLLPTFLFALAWALQRHEEMTMGILFTALMLGILYTAYCLVKLIHAKATSGSVLLELGPLPSAKLFCFGAAVLVFLGIYDAFLVVLALFMSSNVDTVSVEGPSLFEAMLGVVCLFAILDFFAIGMAAIASRRHQFRENGILIGTRLLKWDRVNSFKWESESWLLVNVKTRFPSLGKAMFPVPSEHKTLAEKILSSHCTLEKDS